MGGPFKKNFFKKKSCLKINFFFITLNLKIKLIKMNFLDYDFSKDKKSQNWKKSEYKIFPNSKNLKKSENSKKEEKIEKKNFSYKSEKIKDYSYNSQYSIREFNTSINSLNKFHNFEKRRKNSKNFNSEINLKKNGNLKNLSLENFEFSEKSKNLGKKGNFQNFFDFEKNKKFGNEILEKKIDDYEYEEIKKDIEKKQINFLNKKNFDKKSKKSLIFENLKISEKKKIREMSKKNFFEKFEKSQKAKKRTNMNYLIKKDKIKKNSIISLQNSILNMKKKSKSRNSQNFGILGKMKNFGKSQKNENFDFKEKKYEDIFEDKNFLDKSPLELEKILFKKKKN